MTLTLIRMYIYYYLQKLGDIKSKFEKKKEDLEEKMWVDKSYTYLRSRLDKDEEFLKTRHANFDRTVK